MKEKLKKYSGPIIIVAISILVCLPMFVMDFNIQYDDGIQHICRLIGTEQSISEGNKFGAIMSNFCNGFGYSWNLFYSPLTSFAPLIFRIFGLSYALCLKLFMLCITVASGFAMRSFIKTILDGIVDEKRREQIAILAGIMYICMPYRLNDMYIRVAVAELASFVFLPMVFDGLYKIINKEEKSYLPAIGATGMILSHVMITTYVAIFSIIYILVNLNKIIKLESKKIIINKKIIIMLIKNLLFILLFTGFYLFPLLESKLSADYEVFNSEHMLRIDAMKALKPNIIEMIMQVDGRMAYGIGILTILGIVIRKYIWFS